MVAVGDEWILVTRKSRHRARFHTKTSKKTIEKTEISHSVPAPPDKTTLNKICKSIALAKAKLKGGKLVQAIVQKTIETNNTRQSTWSIGDTNKEKCISIICYGLGSFCTNSNAVKQLALSINIYEELRSQVGDNSVHNFDIYDPVMTETDKAIAREAGLNVLNINVRGYHKAERTTVFIMPHCGRLLYHNTLVANLTCRCIDNIVIIGNSFRTYNTSIMKTSERRQSAIIAMLFYTSEMSLDFDVPESDPHYFQYESAFNDLSVHTFSKTSMEKASKDSAVQFVLRNSSADAFDDEVVAH